MLSLERQERYRRRYAEMRPNWRPSSHVYRDLVAAHLSPGARVLDLGCGRGGVMERLHQEVALTIGLDPDYGSLCDHRAPILALACGLAEALPYADNGFDLVCSSWVLEHLPAPGRAFAEAARVLGPGGRFIFLTPNARHPLLVLNRALNWTQGRPVDRLYDRPQADVFPAFYRANSPRRIGCLARAAGFERVWMKCLGDPTYLAVNKPLSCLACALEDIMPYSRRVHLVGVCATG